MIPPSEWVTSAKVTVRMMVLAFGVLGHAPDGVDPVEEGSELDRPAQGPVGAFPAVEIPGGGVHLFIG